MTETLTAYNNQCNTRIISVGKNAVHIVGLICMLMQDLDKNDID